ncbi:hypothetical protein ACFY8C_27125 [Streptomyces flavochromogenes]|uniref:Transposase Helix-turn-helix domain-containing protein n=1 Tax=Streptomyces flavochromogenes TaxID=68199 RepID=A0ABW6XWU3_9ACTN
MFTDRIIITPVVLRSQLPHSAPAVLYGVDRSTITRAVHEIRPLSAARGFAVPGRRAFVSGKMRQNTKKATVVPDGRAALSGLACSGPAACTTRRR